MAVAEEAYESGIAAYIDTYLTEEQKALPEEEQRQLAIDAAVADGVTLDYLYDQELLNVYYDRIFAEITANVEITEDEIVAKYDDRGAAAVGNIDRFKFYDEAKDCYCVIQTGETAIYANVIVQKGVIK